MARVKSWSLQFVLVLAAALLTLSAAKAETTLKDPVAYCQAVGTVDAPDAKYSGPGSA
jgi:hypothetical protein